MHPTMKFYERLLGANAYELVLAEVAIGQSQPSFADERFVLLDRSGRPITRRVDLVNACLQLAYRKTQDEKSRAPFSHWNADESTDLLRVVSDNFVAFYSDRLDGRDRRHSPANNRGDRSQSQLAQPLPFHLEKAEKLADRVHEKYRTLQVYEHEHSDKLFRDLQQRDHDHSDVLSAALQQQRQGYSKALFVDLQKHEHECLSSVLHELQGLEHEYRKSLGAITNYAPLLWLATLLNGSVLLLGLARGPLGSEWFFALGFVSAFLASVTAWSDLMTSRTLMGKLARHSSRALWVLSARLHPPKD